MRRWAILVCLGLAVGCESSTEAVPEHPNIILVLVDDLDWASLTHLPGLERLADEGLTFDNYFVSTSACAPSRASYLTGRYAHNHGVLTNHGVLEGHYPIGGYSTFLSQGRETSTVAVALQAAGYRTALFGKYMNEYPVLVDSTYVPPGWTEWYASPTHYYDWTLNENGELVAYRGGEYETDVLAEKAADFIRRSTAGGEPFFIYMAPYAAHEPAEPAPRHAGAFAGVQAPRSPSFNEADVSDKPASIAGRDLLTQGTIDEFDQLFRRRLRSLLAVEDLLDTLAVTLEQTGAAEETYVLFTSDNGYHYGQHRLNHGKLLAYDEDIRVPLIVRGPGIAAGARRDELVVNIDIAPTLIQLAGAPSLVGADGRSLMPLFFAPRFGPVGWERGGVLLQRWRPRAEVAPTEYFWHGYRALRTDDYLYVEWDTGEFELYDIEADPYQMENIHSDADPQLIAELAGWMDRVGGCSGSGCRIAEAGR